ncbi:uroporphyrinogen-III synthase [Sphingosinicella sp. LHD-64]|uniref:uroporphyrinogen-III synthase n=1 Tax=Sphingosinicella sp. LHD-64 TaxID=3072139 RepID=UPI0028101D31|nr:uroporphyrinogen-III synthase [Sphingosinicella sp. LHD-64]MDQ8757090.1 uroporphyrinogen-III synthase [Sphingosinicella sp. LHD-64]
MSVWITRSAPDNLATARRLRAVGVRPLLVPVIETRPLPQRPVTFRPAAITFSSVHAVRHYDLRDELLDVPVFVRSEEIANAARHAGYLAITSTAGDEPMLHELLARAVPAHGQLLHVCAERTSGMLEAALRKHGTQVARCCVYRPVAVESDGLSRLVDRLSGVNAIVLHSSIGHAVVREAIAAAGWRGPIWCISPQSAGPFRDLAGVAPAVATAPTEHALIELIRRQTGGRNGPGPDRRGDDLNRLAQSRRKTPVGWLERAFARPRRPRPPANDRGDPPAD